MNKDNLTVEEFIIKVNKIRRNNKNRWFAFGCKVEGKTTYIKFYNTWIQKFEIGGKNYGSSIMEMKVSEFTQHIKDSFNNYREAL